MQVYNKNTKNNVNKTETNYKKDKIEISKEAREFQQAVSKVKDMPDIRQEKVDEIKQRVLSGNYEINSEKIADKILSGSRLIEKYNEW